VHRGPREGMLGTNPLAAQAVGALDAAALRGGQLFRLLTYALVHADAVHFITNLAVVLVAAWIVERLLGGRAVVTAFVAGTAAGGWTACALAPHVVVLGASGAALALVAAALVGSVARGGWRAPEIGALACLAALTLLGAEPGQSAAGHAAGFGAGLAAATLFVAAPRLAAAAVAPVAVASLVAAAVAAAPALPDPTLLERAALLEALAPDATLSALLGTTVSDSAAAVAAWPGDPRVQVVHGQRLLGSLDGAVVDVAGRGGAGAPQAHEAAAAAMTALEATRRLSFAFADGEVEAAARLLFVHAAPLAGPAELAARGAQMGAVCDARLAATLAAEVARREGLCQTAPVRQAGE
jgi:membrane associated rhomboid family serine protease